MSARVLALMALMALASLSADAQDPAPAPEAAPAEAAAAEAAPAEAAPAEATPAEAAPAETAPASPPPPEDLRQVQIQVMVSETTEQGMREIGVNLDYQRFVDGMETSGAVERIRTQLFDPVTTEHGVVLPAPDVNPFPDNLRPDLSGTLADGVQTQSGAGLTFTIIDADNGTIEGIMRASERKADVDLISKPELLVVNGTTAEIHAGGEVPYQSVSFQAQPVGTQLKVAWKKVGVDMKLTPTIQEDLVDINLADTGLSVSDVVRIEKIRGIDLPVLSVRSQTGRVVVPNGQTLVIGGLSSRIVRKNESRVPIVGRLPIVGMPFRARKSEVSNSTLLVFVSPTVVDLRDLQPEAISAINFWKEGQWEHTEDVARESQIMEQEP